MPPVWSGPEDSQGPRRICFRKRTLRRGLVALTTCKILYIKTNRNPCGPRVSVAYPNPGILAFLAFPEFRQMNNLRVFNWDVRFDSPRRHHSILDDRIAQSGPSR